jgi:hypothetical protein
MVPEEHWVIPFILIEKFGILVYTATVMIKLWLARGGFSKNTDEI